MTYNSSEGILRHLSPVHASQPTSYPLPTDREVVIGRDYSCQIVIDSHQYDRVSRHHVAIRPLDPNTAAREWMIYDLKSANGTFINGQRLQGGQVLRVGDRITLSENGPELIFEYQPLNQPTSLPQRPNTALNRGQPNEIVELNEFWIEHSPTRLVIHRGAPAHKVARRRLVGWLWVLVISTIWFYVSPVTFILALFPLTFFGLFGLLVAAAQASHAYEVAYTFDLEKGEFTLAKQSWVDGLFNRYRFTSDRLSDLTAVRLSKSKYEGDEGSKYDTYTIHLDRVADTPIDISIPTRNDQTTAQQLLDIIDEFLASAESE